MEDTTNLSHFDPKSGEAKMVDVGSKKESSRIAVAQAQISISSKLCEHLVQKKLEKGNAFAIAKTAGILAAKQTQNLIPLCHSLPLDYVNIDIHLDAENLSVTLTSEASTTAKTGVEMEALTAASIAALTFYDMCKAVDKTIIIKNIGLVSKTGGKSGFFENPFFKS